MVRKRRMEHVAHAADHSGLIQAQQKIIGVEVHRIGVA